MTERKTDRRRQLDTALVIGGTGFVGRHTVAALYDHDYEVTVASRNRRETGFDSGGEIEHVTLDRTDADALSAVADRVRPDLVVDCAALYPGEVRTATRVFANVPSYVYVSSGGVYADHTIPKREGETPLHDCTPEQASGDSLASYGPRKAECDREASVAAERGVTAMSVRPTMVYGPKTVQSVADDSQTATATGTEPADATWADRPGLQTHHDYWIDRVERFDSVVVPGDGTAIWHRAYVEDVASAIRVVAERGVPGRAYNVGDRRVCTIDDVIELIVDALDTSVNVVHASERDLAAVGLDPDDFVLYHHLGSRYPHVLDTCRIAALGWESTPVDRAMERTVAESLASGRDGSAFDPGRQAEERVLARLGGRGHG